ncbi:hypothetical protein [Marinimicrobium sp. ABcell2]|uniref:hypothetical protein n=1 Tax=Marinimicrobium sp. ABcell2 TaxID=3069751 RepID=UPI0027AF3C3F|nr:hypothetical protein [Marinimicrobium sp. ABcell2]MDQ2076555.1 hypothetical protein [Marinimicrobium sp. ABcell2]
MQSRLKARLLTLAIMAWASVGIAGEDESTLHARLWVGAMTPERIAYETAAIELAFKKTQVHAGDYQLTLVPEERSTERSIRELREGSVINLASAPIWPINLEPDPPMDIVPIALANGLMGYRRLIVRKGDLGKFESLSSLAELSELSAGLGRGWSDVAVFQKAGLPVVEGTNIPLLYSMLVRERFDYFPLGSLEVEDSLAASGFADDLTIVPNLIIYYPLPINVQVSINKPELTQRIEQGLKAAKADGSLQSLFDEHYQGLVSKLQQLNPKVVVLENPNMPDVGVLSEPLLLPESPVIR